MLLSRTNRLAMEALVEVTGAPREWMHSAELGGRIDAEVPFPKVVPNRLSHAGVIQSERERQCGSEWPQLSSDLISNRPIPTAAPLVHPGKHWDLQICVVVYDYFSLEVMQAVKASSILGKCSTP